MATKKKLDNQYQRKLFDDRRAAVEALDAFNAELFELRKKHGINNVQFVAEVDWMEDDGEASAMTVGGFGDELKAETLFAYGLGHVQAERQSRIAAILKAAGRFVNAKAE